MFWYERCAGLDVHRDTVVATARVPVRACQMVCVTRSS